MLKKLSVSNFKSWETGDLEFGKVTAMFGANSSGKTSLLQLLLALKQTDASRDRKIFNFGGDSRDLVDLGNYQSVVHGHNTKISFGFTLIWSPLKFENHHDITFDQAKIEVSYAYSKGEVVVKERTLSAHVRGFNYILDENGDTGFIDGDYEDLVKRQRDGSYKSWITRPDIAETTRLSSAQAESFHAFEVSRSSKAATMFEKPDAEWGMSEPSYYISDQLSRLLDSMTYIGPLRAFPEREYRWTGERPTSVGTRGENAVRLLLAEEVIKQAATPVAASQELLLKVNEWFNRLGLAEKVVIRRLGSTSQLYDLAIVPLGYKHVANLADVGFGVSQVLPIVLMSYVVPEGSILILEQPEIHLHPKVQAELADLFLEVALERNVQFLIESHSEHILNRLQHRMIERKGKFAALQNGDVRLYFCRRESKTSVLDPVQIGEAGKVANVPTDFYDPISDFIGTLQVNVDGQPTDLSERHDDYIAKELSRQLREKDDQSE